MSKSDDIEAAASDAQLLACTGVSRYVFDFVYRRYCGVATPIKTRYDCCAATLISGAGARSTSCFGL